MKNIFTLLFLFLLIGCDKELTSDLFVPFAWETTTPELAGMDRQLLDSAFIIATEKGFIDGLLVVKKGKIVAEAYYNQFTKDHPHNIMSISKSMLSAIVGHVIYGDFNLDLEDKVLDYFPEYIYQGIDSRKYEITIQHLLTMRMGIEGESAENYGVYSSLYQSDNWIKNTIEYPLILDPGEKMRYNTFITHLLSGVITKVTGNSTKAYADENLFNPMGIDIDDWEQDPQGIYFGGNSIHITPREIAVLGLLYLNGGRLNDKQIIPSEWVEYSISPSTNYTHPNEWGAWKNYNYASLWWLGQFNGYDSFMGYGYGGQFLIVFPALDLIVVSTAKNDVPPEATNEQEWSVFEIVSRYILTSCY